MLVGRRRGLLGALVLAGPSSAPFLLAGAGVITAAATIYANWGRSRCVGHGGARTKVPERRAIHAAVAYCEGLEGGDMAGSARDAVTGWLALITVSWHMNNWFLAPVEAPPRIHRVATASRSERSEQLQLQLKALPDTPGVYLFHGASGEVLYVGKAKSLRKRVQSYFRGVLCRPAHRRARRSGSRTSRCSSSPVRDRGAAARAEPDQAPPADVQHPPARRQVLPLHRRHRRRRVPAGDVHPRAPPQGRPVLRPVLERAQGARDARRAEPRVPVPPVRGPAARPPLGRAVPRLPHRPLRSPVRRATSPRRSTRR